MHALQEFKNMAPHVSGHSLKEFFSEPQIAFVERTSKQPGTCGGCGKHMTQNEQWPPGKATPRAYCQACWQQVQWGRCLVCLRALHDDERIAQKRDPLDAHNRVHKKRYMQDENPCQDPFIIMTAHLLGVRTGIIELEKWYVQPPQPVIPYQPEIVDYDPRRQHDYIEAEYTVKPGKIRRIGVPNQNARRALPMPDYSNRIDNVFQKTRGGRVYAPIRGAR